MEGKISVKYGNKDFRKLFLLTFTRELIKNSGSQISRLKRILEGEGLEFPREEIREKIKDVIKTKEM